jgi:TonB-dependent starch-binding outer membrane protein SusC
MYKNYFRQLLLVMKLTTLLMLLGLMQVSASTLAQKVSLSANKAPINAIFDQIEQQTGYDFAFTGKTLELAKPVTIQVKDAELSVVLLKIFANQPLTYVINDKTITVQQKVPITTNTADSKPVTPVQVSAKVVNELGQPLVGATVKEKGTANATLTDNAGKFSLTVSDNTAIVVITYIGYAPVELAAKNIATGSAITLKPAENNLREVVISKGYYDEKRELSTGDVSVVGAKEIEQQPVSNVLGALEGRVPGLFITQGTGTSGSTFTVNIRGLNSLQNGNDPLYIIDGVPYNAHLLPNNDGSLLNNSSPLSFLNPYDIESLTVLKDADATSIYGIRGANGVIVITTKKGSAGDTKINFNINQGAGEVARTFDLMNLQQYLTMRNEAFANDGATPGTYDYDVNGTWDQKHNTNWQKLLIGNTANYTNAQGTISGGNTNTQYLLSANYYRQSTVFPGDFADQKGSLHFNLNSRSENNKFTITFTGNYLYDHNHLPDLDPTTQLILPPDTPPIYNADGSLNWANSTWSNPLSILTSEYKVTTNNLVTNLLLSYKIVGNLEAKVSLGYTYQQQDDILTYPSTYFDPSYNVQGSASFTNSNINSYILEPQLTYNREIGKGKLNLLAGTTLNEINSNGQILNGSGYTSDALLESIQGAALITKGQITNSQYKYRAIFGRLNYTYDDKYLFNATIRRDGSSRFGPGNQYANFAAAGLGWIFSKEDFLKNSLDFLSFGKLRANYGTSGSDQIGDYRYLSLYNFTTGIPYQSAIGLYPNNLANPNFAWELNKKLDLGIELGLLQDRIFLTADYYRNRSSNELLQTVLPDITGFTFVQANLPATVQNTGLEFSLSSTNIKTATFKWKSAINLTLPSNKLIAFPGLANSPYASIYVIGQPVNSIKVYNLKGVDPATGVYQFIDHNGQLTFTPDYTADRTKNVNLNPKFYGGLQNTFTYKSFQLDFLFQFVKQTGQNNLFAINVPPGASGYYNQPVYDLNRWQKPGDIAPIEKYTQAYGSPAYNAYQYAQLSTAAYSDASYIRLKNLSLAYQFPDVMIHKIKLKGLQVNVRGENLLTFTKFQGADPENQSTNYSPLLRTLTAGIKVDL